MRCLSWWIKKVSQEYGDDVKDQDEPADWWKADESE